MPFVVVPEIDLTETVDLIILFRRQPSICLTIESPTVKVFFFPFSLFSFSGGLFPRLRPSRCYKPLTHPVGNQKENRSWKAPFKQAVIFPSFYKCLIANLPTILCLLHSKTTIYLSHNKNIHDPHIIYTITIHRMDKPKISLPEICPNTEFLLVHIFLYLELNILIQSKYSKIRIRKISVFGHFSHSLFVYNVGNLPTKIGRWKAPTAFWTFAEAIKHGSFRFNVSMAHLAHGIGECLLIVCHGHLGSLKSKRKPY